MEELLVMAGEGAGGAGGEVLGLSTWGLELLKGCW